MKLHKIEFKKIKEKYTATYNNATKIPQEKKIKEEIIKLENTQKEEQSNISYSNDDLENAILQKDNDKIIKNLLAKKFVEINKDFSESTQRHLKQIIRSIKDNTGLWIFIIFLSMGMFREVVNRYGIVYTLLFTPIYGIILYGIYVSIKRIKIRYWTKKEYVILKKNLNEIINRYNEEILYIYDLLLKKDYKKIKYKYVTEIERLADEQEREMDEAYRNRYYD